MKFFHAKNLLNILPLALAFLNILAIANAFVASAPDSQPLTVSLQGVELQQDFVSCHLPWEQTEVEKMFYCNTSRDYLFCESFDDSMQKCFTFEDVETGENWVEFDLGNNQKQQMIFTKKTVFEEGTEIVPFKEKHSLSLKNGNFLMGWGNGRLELETELSFSVSGTIYTIAGFKSLSPGIDVKTFEENLEGSTKFWYEVQNVPQEIREKLEFIKLTVKPSKGFTTQSIDSVEEEATDKFETVLPEDLSIDFSDLVNQESFDLDFENPYTLIIRDKDPSDGKWGETISLDPVFQSSAPSEDVYLGVTATDASNRIFMKFDISSVPAGATINSATLQMNVATDSDDDDYVFYHLDQNQGWNESASVTGIYAMRTGTFSSVSSCYTTTGDQNCSITSVFQAAYNQGDSNFSFRIDDPDQNASAPTGKTNTATLKTGTNNDGAEIFVYKTFSSSEGSNPPILFVDYNNTGAITAPSALQADANSTYALNGGRGAMRLTWTDNSNNEDGFRIYRGQNDNNFVLLGTVSAGTTSYNDLNVSDNNTLFYKVSAYNLSGDANTSIDTNTTFDRSAPSAPTLTLSNGSNYADLNWTFSDDNANSGIDLNLIAYWRMDETSGTFVLDSADGDQNGTTQNMEAADWATGKMGRDLNFDGVNEFALINTNSNDFNHGTGAFSWAGWIKTNDTGNYNTILSYGTYDPGLSVHGTSGYLWIYDEPTPNDLNTTVAGFNNGQWHHFAVVRTGTGANQTTIYKDGAQAATVTYAGTISKPSQLRLGYDNSAGDELTGQLDDIRIYNKAITAADVNRLYLSGARRYDAYRSTNNSTFSLITSGYDLNTYSNTSLTDQNNPQTPSAPTVTAINSTTLDVNWSAVSDNNTSYYYKINSVDSAGNDSNSSTGSVSITGSGVAKYFVNCVSGGSCGAGVGTGDDYNSSARGKSMTNLSEGTQYCFTLLATDGADNNSSASSQTCGTTTVSAVSGLTATSTAGPFNSTDVNVLLSWTDVNGETGYTIYRSDNNSTFTTLSTSVAAGSNSYTDASALDNNRYFFKVQTNGAANDANSSVVSVTTQDRTAPTAGSLTLTTVPSSNRIDLDFNNSTDNNTGASTVTVVLTPSEDVYLTGPVPSGGGEDITSAPQDYQPVKGTISLAEPLEIERRHARTFMKFSLSSIPTGATIVSAKLQMTTETENDDDDVAFYRLDQNQAWTESASAAGIYAMRTGNFLLATSCYTAAEDQNCTITPLVRASFLAGDTNFSLRLEDPDTNSISPDTKTDSSALYTGNPGASTNTKNKFSSSEGNNSPKLFVEYSTTSFDYNVFRSATGQSGTFSKIVSTFDGNNSYSDTAATDTNSPNAPGAPTVTGGSTSSVTVSWSAPSDRGDDYFYFVDVFDAQANDANTSTASDTITTGVSRYFVNCVSGGSCSAGIDPFDGYSSTTSRGVGGLGSSTTYCFTVLAIDGVDNNSAASSTGCGSTVGSGGGSVCGNGVCEAGETIISCRSDCVKKTIPAKPSIAVVDEPEFSSQPVLTCEEQKGTACNPTEHCEGTWVNSTNSPRCCVGSCYSDPEIGVQIQFDEKAEEGKNASVVVTVFNYGGDTKSPFGVLLEETVDRAGKFSLRKTVQEVRKGDGLSLVFEVPFDEGLVYSSAEFSVIADPDGALAEQEKENNKAVFRIYFAGPEKCSDSTDNDLDRLIDEECGLALVSPTKVFAKPIFSAGNLQQMELEVVLLSEYADAKNFYVNLYKDDPHSTPVSSKFVNLLAEGKETKIQFTYDYSLGVALAPSQEEIGEFFLEIKGEGLAGQAGYLSIPNMYNITPPLPSSRDLSFEFVQVPRILAVGENAVISGSVLDSLAGPASFPFESPLPASSTARPETFSYPLSGTGREATQQARQRGAPEIEVDGTITVSLYVDNELAGMQSVQSGRNSEFSFSTGSLGLMQGEHDLLLVLDEEGSALETDPSNNEFPSTIGVIGPDEVFVSPNLLDAEIPLVAFWAEKEYALNSFYEFLLISPLTDPVLVPDFRLSLASALYFRRLRTDFDLIIYKFPPMSRQQPNADFENDYSIKVLRRTGTESTQIGQPASVGFDETTPENIFNEGANSIENIITGDYILKRASYERLSSLTSLLRSA